jgi:hypothetical protein
MAKLGSYLSRLALNAKTEDNNPKTEDDSPKV